jgi:predicted TIM-barrel fold metal-dependent hydrolase
MKKGAKSSQGKTIDYHHHVFPPEYVVEMKKLGIQGNTAVKFPAFDAARNLKLMDRVKIDKAMLSISTPGVYVKDDRTAAKLARLCNDYIKATVEENPGRYGGLGVLPYPALKESLEEMEYIFDTLHLDGIGVLTNANGTYFGEAGYDELFGELNRRKALVFIHPEDLLIHEGAYTIITLYFERCLSTVRSAYNLLLNGYLEKYPDIRFILSHGGGGLPVMARRIVRESLRKANQPDNRDLAGEKMALLKNLYYDTGQKGIAMFNSLNEFCGSDHIVFGSDIPFQPGLEVAMIQKELSAYEGFSAEEKAKIRAGSGLNNHSMVRS